MSRGGGGGGGQVITVEEEGGQAMETLPFMKGHGGRFVGFITSSKWSFLPTKIPGQTGSRLAGYFFVHGEGLHADGLYCPANDYKNLLMQIMHGRQMDREEIESTPVPDVNYLMERLLNSEVTGEIVMCATGKLEGRNLCFPAMLQTLSQAQLQLLPCLEQFMQRNMWHMCDKFLRDMHATLDTVVANPHSPAMLADELPAMVQTIAPTQTMQGVPTKSRSEYANAHTHTHAHTRPIVGPDNRERPISIGQHRATFVMTEEMRQHVSDNGLEDFNVQEAEEVVARHLQKYLLQKPAPHSEEISVLAGVINGLYTQNIKGSNMSKEGKRRKKAVCSLSPVYFGLACLSESYVSESSVIYIYIFIYIYKS